MTYDDHEIVEYLVRQAQDGDKDAFSQIVQMMMKDIVALTYRMTQDRDSAFDLAQETFISAWEHLHEFKGESRLQSWLYRIAANKTLNFLKQRSRQSSIPTDSTSAGEVSRTSGTDNPEQALQSAQLRQGVLDFLAELPAQQRLVFELHFYKGHTFQQIAYITGKAVGTVKTHYREAVIKLRTYAKKRGWVE
jgi:RNA polymerase sigma-70 factor (ECF subfamily)